MELFSLYYMVGFFLLIFVLSQVLFYKHKSPFSYPNLPPGRIGWPILGESLEFLSTGWKGHPEKFVNDRMVKYNTQCFKTSILMQPMAVLGGQLGNKFLFSNENKLVTSWWPDSINKIFQSTQQHDSEEEAKKLRKLLPQFFEPKALQKYIGVMDNITQKHFKSAWENNKEILVFPLAKSYTFWVACRLFLSVEDPNHIARFAEPFNRVTNGIIGMPINLPGTPLNKGIKAAKFIRKELIEIIKQRKVDLAKKIVTPNQDILSHMLTVRNESGEWMSDVNIADKILGLLIGGHDTTSAAITFIVKYLAELPHVYEAVYKEQMEIAKSKEEGEMLNWEDINKMKYSWNVACEVLRLAPPLQGAFREAMTDFIYGGYTIPKGWKLYWSTHSTHRNPQYFPDPDKFDPNRFNGEGPAPYTFVPFGGGPRMCPGKEYARLEILVFMHNLVKRFKWEKLLPNEKIIVNPLPMPAKGLPIRLIPYNNMQN